MAFSEGQKSGHKNVDGHKNLGHKNLDGLYITLRLNLVACETAWGEAQKAWETGLGAELDGIIYGVKVINKIFLFF